MIELLDFNLPLSDNAAFSVPVTAEPQALMLWQIGGPWETPQNHEQESYGYCGDDLSQCCHYWRHNDYTTAAVPIQITTPGKVLNGENLLVSVAAWDSNNITLNCSGSDLASDIRVHGWALSGINWARVEVQPTTPAGPITFSSAPEQPDLAIVIRAGGPPDGVPFETSNQGTRTRGFLTATAQICGQTFIASPKSHQSMQALTGHASYFWDSINPSEEYYYLGALNSTGFVLTPDGPTVSRGFFSTSALMIKGVESDFGWTQLRATNGNQVWNFAFDPEVVWMLGSANLALDTRENTIGAPYWPHSSHAFFSPPVQQKGLWTGDSTNPSFNVKRRAISSTGRLDGIPGNSTQRYAADLVNFGSQTMTLAISADGSGDPTNQYYMQHLALRATGAPPPVLVKAGAPFDTGPFG